MASGKAAWWFASSVYPLLAIGRPDRAISGTVARLALVTVTWPTCVVTYALQQHAAPQRPFAERAHQRSRCLQEGLRRTLASASRRHSCRVKASAALPSSIVLGESATAEGVLHLLCAETSQAEHGTRPGTTWPAMDVRQAALLTSQASGTKATRRSASGRT